MSQQIYELKLSQLSHKVNQGRASREEKKEFEKRIENLKYENLKNENHNKDSN